MGRPGIRTGEAGCARTSALIPVEEDKKKEEME
jgi:hypothetical protein